MSEFQYKEYQAEPFEELHTEGTYRYFTNGKWKLSSSGKTIPVYNPYNNEKVSEVQACTKDEIDEAIKVANDQNKCWEEVPLRERAEILYKAADIIDAWAEELGKILTKTIGKPLESSISEITRTAEIFRFTAEAGVQMKGETDLGDAFFGYSRKKIATTYRAPLGTILCIGPFNYPFNLTGTKIAPAIMTGNSVVVKPPTDGAILPLYYGRIFTYAGLPPGILNIVTGRGSEIGDHLVSHPGIDMVAFTGSSATGKRISKTAGMKPLQLELGGKDAAIVMHDADLERTSSEIVSGGFSYSGQRCTAVKRVLPMPQVANELIQKVVEKTKKLTLGDPMDNKNIGPLINKKSVEYVQDLIEDALEKGAKLLMGNKYDKDHNTIYPTILDNVTEDMRIAWEEPFGPVLPFIRVKDVQEAIDVSNKSKYGLQGMVFTNDIDLAFNIAQELEVGVVQINAKSSRGPDHFPFLGVKSSGLGTQGIEYSLEMMSRPKTVVMNLSERGKKIRSCTDAETENLQNR